MGYTHYWTQPKDYAALEWRCICEDVALILATACGVHEVTLAWECDKPNKPPALSAKLIRFNGIGEEGHESFYITRKRAKLESWQGSEDFGHACCKTAHKPYDVAVTAVLVYLAAVRGWHVGSDGNTSEWRDGVDVARDALPRFRDSLRVPSPVVDNE